MSSELLVFMLFGYTPLEKAPFWRRSRFRAFRLERGIENRFMGHAVSASWLAVEMKHILCGVNEHVRGSSIFSHRLSPLKISVMGLGWS